MSMRSMIVSAVFCAVFASGASANLIINGDFEDPTLAGISSDYLHTPGGNVVEGSWWVSPWNPGSPWWPVQHTPGGRGAMSVNGDNSSLAGVKRVWHQTVSVVPGTPYEFSTWALGTQAGFTGYSLQFRFDQTNIGTVFSPTAANIWEEFSATFTPASSSVNISVVNVSGITFPNDFMLDDIALVAIPEPAFTGLPLTLAALALRRNRR